MIYVYSDIVFSVGNGPANHALSPVEFKRLVSKLAPCIRFVKSFTFLIRSFWSWFWKRGSRANFSEKSYKKLISSNFGGYGYIFFEKTDNILANLSFPGSCRGKNAMRRQVIGNQIKFFCRNTWFSVIKRLMGFWFFIRYVLKSRVFPTTAYNFIPMRRYLFRKIGHKSSKIMDKKIASTVGLGTVQEAKKAKTVSLNSVRGRTEYIRPTVFAA